MCCFHNRKFSKLLAHTIAQRPRRRRLKVIYCSLHSILAPSLPSSGDNVRNMLFLKVPPQSGVQVMEKLLQVKATYRAGAERFETFQQSELRVKSLV